MLDYTDARKQMAALLPRIQFYRLELLCILTLGILSFWVASYYNAAIAEFYQSLLPQKQMQATEDLPPV